MRVGGYYTTYGAFVPFKDNRRKYDSLGNRIRREKKVVKRVTLRKK
jgi:hypothetical protein